MELARQRKETENFNYKAISSRRVFFAVTKLKSRKLDAAVLLNPTEFRTTFVELFWTKRKPRTRQNSIEKLTLKLFRLSLLATRVVLRVEGMGARETKCAINTENWMMLPIVAITSLLLPLRRIQHADEIPRIHESSLPHVHKPILWRIALAFRERERQQKIHFCCLSLLWGPPPSTWGWRNGKRQPSLCVCMYIHLFTPWDDENVIFLLASPTATSELSSEHVEREEWKHFLQPAAPHRNFHPHFPHEMLFLCSSYVFIYARACVVCDSI